MPTPFWTSKESLDQLNQLDRPGFAVEFLRRNPDYRADCIRVLSQAKRGVVTAEAEFARRWGVRFSP